MKCQNYKKRNIHRLNYEGQNQHSKVSLYASGELAVKVYVRLWETLVFIFGIRFSSRPLPEHCFT